MTGVRTFDGWHDFAAARVVLEQQLPAGDVDWLERVYEFAVDRHAGQTRPAGEPYARHLLEVVDLLVNGVGATDRCMLAAGMLHDTVEDTDTALDEIGERFGAEVADLVGWVTQPAEEGSRSRYPAHLREAPSRVLTLKLSDRASNVQRLDTHPRPAKQRSYYRETVAHIMPLSAGHPFFEPWFQQWQETFAHLEAPSLATDEARHGGRRARRGLTAIDRCKTGRCQAALGVALAAATSRSSRKPDPVTSAAWVNGCTCPSDTAHKGSSPGSSGVSSES